jgi:hypothetical protein
MHGQPALGGSLTTPAAIGQDEDGVWRAGSAGDTSDMDRNVNLRPFGSCSWLLGR